MKNMVLCVVWMLTVLCTANAQSYMFKHLEVKDGLSNNQVNAIYKDSDGYMWFATASGLNRYDGYDIRVYRSEPGDSTSLPDFLAGQLHIFHSGGRGRFPVDTDGQRICPL